MRTIHRATITATIVAVSGLTTVLTSSAQTEVPAGDDEAVVAEQAAGVEVLDPTEAFIERLTVRPAAIAAVAGEDQLIEVFLSRDPFQPVVPVESTETSGDPSSDGVTDGSGTSGGTEGGTVGANDDGSDCAGSTSETVCDGVVVTPVSVGDDTAVIMVNGVSYEVGEGEVFAGSFSVVDLAAPCVSLMYGDEGFSVCEGASVLK